MKKHHLIPGILLLGLWMTGCKDKGEIKVYRVAKADSSVEKPMVDHPGMGSMPQMGASMSSDSPNPQAPSVTGNPPSGWEAQPLSSMRQASYLVKGANGEVVDISLVSLAGVAGGALDNVNRWLGQLGKPAITEEQLGQMAQRLSAPLGDVLVVDLEGLQEGGDATKDGRIIAGIVTEESGTFFFKMRGNAALAAAQKAAFLQWIGTVKLAAAPPAPLPPQP